MKLLSPKPDTTFCWFNDRPALFHAAPDHGTYWQSYWGDETRERLMRAGQAGDFGEFGTMIERYVPTGEPVLEAGCGPARIVAALEERGYDAIGVDYEPEVVRFVNETCPDLDVRTGNVLSLDLPDGVLGAYLSFGVVEHFTSGPLEALREARRVLREGGAALVSVPYANPLRRRYFHALDRGVPPPAGLTFHQYYFEVDEFAAMLERVGFDIMEWQSYSAETFLTREHPLFSRFWHSPACRERMKRPLRRLLADPPAHIGRRFGHMVLFACRAA